MHTRKRMLMWLKWCYGADSTGDFWGIDFLLFCVFVSLFLCFRRAQRYTQHRFPSLRNQRSSLTSSSRHQRLQYVNFRMLFLSSLVSHEPSLSERTCAEALTLVAACWGWAQCDGCRRSVLTTRVEQGQRFRQRQGLKERSAVVDTVERCIYRAQWTEGFSRTSYTGWQRSAPTGG